MAGNRKKIKVEIVLNIAAIRAGEFTISALPTVALTSSKNPALIADIASAARKNVMI